jgi:SAM-dependent methyltransferase
MKAAFDEPAAVEINEARGRTLSTLLVEIKNDVGIANGLDAGCGFGYFANLLSQAGLDMTAFDGRSGNVAEAARRYPQIKFDVWNVEDPSLAGLGKFDFVSCFGLLYHLENPFLAIRNIVAVTGKVLVLESVVVPYEEPLAVLYEEDKDADQGLAYIALIPSEPLLVKALHVAGMSHVYRVVPPPDHPDFRFRVGKKRRRTVLAASRAPLRGSLERLAEPRTRQYLWDTLPGLESTAVRGALRAIRGRRTSK